MNIEQQIAYENLIAKYEEISVNHSYLIDILNRNISPDVLVVIKQYLDYLETK